MNVSVSDAKGQLTELVRRAEAGEEIVLTRHGVPVVRLAPIQRRVDAAAKRRTIERIRAITAGRDTSGPDAARSQDFLYDDQGLPK